MTAAGRTAGPVRVGRPSATGRLGVLQPDTLRQRVENAVREAITSGVYAPGERLVERTLCADLGVSRASVREALRRLEAEKLVRTIPHRGPVVAAISVEEARQLYALRAVLEGYAAHAFALNATDAAVEAFERAARALRDAAVSGSRERVIGAKSALYAVLFDHCRNDLVREVIQGLLHRINVLRATSLMHPERLPRSLAEIDALAQAFRARDAEAARRLASLHVENACAVALAELGRQTGTPAARSA
ncbi:GntR family transcriptional regulator [Methylobacterium sp. NEAU 140]|uniref:GntR family transcriptional regulator n=1 Tax=Methylobacterium sp. NEAU 140 TaxID=3064945 RepID=UPI0027327209|nr:GntR family transcriptional regulator [Methylobacterium sp. NEAU 140]MDP4024629.1 GntR family transcriptional regulator [Methylobacterium sp. NEAU 140]